MPEPRYVTPEAPVPTRSEAETQSTTSASETQEGALRLYRLCPCFACSGTGKQITEMPYTRTIDRCKECRGEGRTLDLIATCHTPADLGVAIVTLGDEGEFDECPIGVMRREEGETGVWLIKPWKPSAREVSEAARVLAKSKTNR